jgi:hypothetical protein
MTSLIRLSIGTRIAVPHKRSFADEGVFAEDGGLDDTEFINRPFFEFGEPSAGNDHLVLMSISNSPRFAAI